MFTNNSKYAAFLLIHHSKDSSYKVIMHSSLCPPVLRLIASIWVQNLKFESVGEDVLLSGSHFSCAVEQILLKQQIYTGFLRPD